MTNWKQYHTILALLHLAQQCDGAVTQDHQGFTGYHSRHGKYMAEKVNAGKDLWPDDVKWINDTIPLYMKTQLPFLDPEIFRNECKQMASEAEYVKEKWVKEHTPIEHVKEYIIAQRFLGLIPKANAEKIDQEFLGKLQNWKGRHTEKQEPWVIKLVNKYWNDEWDSILNPEALKNGDAGNDLEATPGNIANDLRIQHSIPSDESNIRESLGNHPGIAGKEPQAALLPATPQRASAIPGSLTDLIHRTKSKTSATPQGHASMDTQKSGDLYEQVLEREVLAIPQPQPQLAIHQTLAEKIAATRRKAALPEGIRGATRNDAVGPGRIPTNGTGNERFDVPGGIGFLGSGTTTAGSLGAGGNDRLLPGHGPDIRLGLTPTNKPTLADLIAKSKARVSEETANDPLSLAVNSDVDLVLTNIQEPPGKKHIDWDDLDPSQKAAIEGMLQEQYCCMTGAAGTGKTTLEKLLIDRIAGAVGEVNIARYSKGEQESTEVRPERKIPSITCIAFTGRATQQTKQKMPETYHPGIMTIHKMLGFYPEMTDVFDEEIQEYKISRRFVPYYDETNKHPWKIVIIDEAGMVDIPLWEKIWAACTPQTRIIMIGDINQLPPVYGMSVFGFALQAWPSFELTTIHRQKNIDPNTGKVTEEQNPIIENAWRVLQGRFPKSMKNFMLIDVDSHPGITTEAVGSERARFVVEGVISSLTNKGVFNKETDGIIVPQNGNDPNKMGYLLGQKPLNAKLCTFFNPPPTKAEQLVHVGDLRIKGKRVLIQIGYFKTHFAVGDKVMVTQNDNDRGLTNGMIGFVTDIKRNGAFGAIEKNDLGEFDIDAAFMTLEGMGNVDAQHGVNAKDGEKEKDEDFKKRAASHIVTVDFGETYDGTRVVEEFSTVGHVSNLVLAYAFTCHKAQGGEYPMVIIVVHSSNHRMLYREWLYTAITRASQRVVILYNNKGLAQAVNRQRIKGDNLAEKAKMFLQLAEGGNPDQIPTLPQAKKMEN